MKQVGILFSISHKAPNGASSFVHSFLSAQEDFSKKNIELHVFSKDNYERCDFSDKRKLQKRHKLKSKILKLVNKSSLLTICYDFLMESRTARKIVKKYLKQEYNDDLIHCQELTTAYYLLKYAPDKKVFLTLHSNGADFEMLFEVRPALNSFWGRKYLYHRLNYVINKTCGIGFVSKKSMEVFSCNHPEIKDKLFYVYNGINEQYLTHKYNKNTKIKFICVGSVCDRKNQKTLIQAAESLMEDYKDRFEITIVGDGPQRLELENYVHTNNLHNINFVGSSMQVDKLLQESDCFVLVSKNEGLPISIIEALRAGLPVIGSNVAGIPEQIIDGQTGYVVAPSISATAEAMKKIIDMGYKNREIMGEKSYKLFLDRFSIKTMFESYAELYNKMMISDNR